MIAGQASGWRMMWKVEVPEPQRPGELLLLRLVLRVMELLQVEGETGRLTLDQGLPGLNHDKAGWGSSHCSPAAGYLVLGE